MKLDRLFFGAALAGLALDRWTKALIQARFILFEEKALLPGLSFLYVRNKGAAFSLLADANAAWRVPFFLLVPAAALVICLHVLRQTPRQDRLSRLGLGLVVGGALGNAWDRLLTGEVVDFIQADLGFWPFHPWPIFNVADSAVCVGVALLLWRSFRPLAETSDK